MGRTRVNPTRAEEHVLLPGRSLTVREVEVVRLVAQGLTNASIATRLGCKLDTVKTHLSRVSLKTGLHSRTQLVVYAYQEGLLEEPERDPVQEAAPAPPPAYRIPPELRERAREVVPDNGDVPPELIALLGAAQRTKDAEANRQWLRRAWAVLQSVASVNRNRKEDS